MFEGMELKIKVAQLRNEAEKKVIFQKKSFMN